MKASAGWRKITPVIVVERIEPVLPFWESRMGFERAMEVPHGDGPGFVMLVKDGLEVMYQTRASAAADGAGAAPPLSSITLYCEVDDLDAAIARLGNIDFAMARRATFYGMEEVAVREPAGNLIMLARKTG